MLMAVHVFLDSFGRGQLEDVVILTVIELTLFTNYSGDIVLPSTLDLQAKPQER